MIVITLNNKIHDEISVKYLILIIFLVILFNLPITFGLDNKSNTELDKIRGDISELQKKTSDSSWQMYVGIAGVSVALLGVFLSNHQTNKSNNISKESFENARKATEADLLLRLNENIYRSVEGKKIIEHVRLNQSVLKRNGGTVDERDLENFLNEVESVAILINQGTMTSEMAEQAFGWVIKIIKENNEIMNYIKKAQERFGDYAWVEITNYVINPPFKTKPGNYHKRSQFSELRIARIQLWSSTMTALGSVAFGVGAALWIAAGSALSSFDPTKDSQFLFSLINAFNKLSPIFTILGLIAILIGFFYPMHLLRDNQTSSI